MIKKVYILRKIISVFVKKVWNLRLKWILNWNDNKQFLDYLHNINTTKVPLLK